MRLRTGILAATLATVLVTAAPVRADGPVELTNYRSGISLVIQGTNGKDYAVERFWHDAPQDDRGVIYIRGDVKIALEHNERNTAHSASTAPFKEIGVNGADGKPASGDEGSIRFIADRDQQVGLSWSSRSGQTFKPGFICPAFEQPFSFADLTYETGVAVIGSIGPKPGAQPGPGFYYRGTRDAFGDEWHTLTVADDDGAFQDDYYSHKWASDGKVFLFIVNPKTPCLGLRAAAAGSQFYTTPAKTYFLPRIHEQTTYVGNGVEIILTNVTNDKVLFYRVDGGAQKKYASPLRSDDLGDGRHVLEYWFEGGAHKIRTIVKNPPWPSAAEQHPRLLWADEAELAGIKARLKKEPYKAAYNLCLTDWNGQKAADARLGRGARDWTGGALTNAFAAFIEGPEAARPGAKRTYVSYAKQMLLDNKLALDPVGQELSHNFAPMPTAEWNSFGYYVVNSVYDLAQAYDLLISFARADKIPGGVTAIEDLKMRDALGGWIAVQLQELRGFEGDSVAARKPSPAPGTGMWDTARLSGAAVAAMAMPAYDTTHHGTSGFDGRTKATHTEVPFEGQAFTWKELFIDADQPVAETPKLRRRFNALDGGLILPDGMFFDRPGYYSYGLMGHCFQILANTAILSCGKRWAYLDHSFERAAEGTLEGKKINTPGDRGPRGYLQVLLANSRFPSIAERIREHVRKQPAKTADGKRNDDYIGFQFYVTNVLGLVWYQDDAF